MMIAVAGIKGRTSRTRAGLALFARVDEEVLDVLDAGAAALGISRAAYLEQFIARVQVDEYGLPAWVREKVDAEQLPLLTELQTNRKKREDAEDTAA